MANRGETKSQKSLSVANLRIIRRKENKWTVKSMTGAHTKESSVPISFILRDLLKLAKTMKEAKGMLNEGLVKVNGKVRKSYRHPVGLFDVVDLEKIGMRLRVVLDSKGRIATKEISAKEKMVKINKIAGKMVVKGGLIQLAANDGSTFLEKKTDINVGDSVLVELPGGKVGKRIEMKEGNLAYIIGGKHSGTVGKIKSIIEGGMNKDMLLTLEGDRGDFQTVEKNVLIVGEKKTEIEI
ncbi:MAG: 30S ribosomal protein S4e [Candidatus Diapherotrites archaeon]